jgi:hypothetical protein
MAPAATTMVLAAIAAWLAIGVLVPARIQCAASQDIRSVHIDRERLSRRARIS